MGLELACWMGYWMVRGAVDWLVLAIPREKYIKEWSPGSIANQEDSNLIITTAPLKRSPHSSCGHANANPSWPCYSVWRIHYFCSRDDVGLIRGMAKEEKTFGSSGGFYGTSSYSSSNSKLFRQYSWWVTMDTWLLHVVNTGIMLRRNLTEAIQAW